MNNIFNLSVKTCSEDININLSVGETLFILGANGTGKSALMHRLYTNHKDDSKWITAHRKTWFTSNAMDLTPASRKQMNEYIQNFDIQDSSRWKDDYYQQRADISIFDLINSENTRARQIAKAVDLVQLDKAKDISLKNQSPIEIVNELFQLSNISVKIELGENEELFAIRDGHKYSIAELSDGERNALLIAAEVLTAKPYTLVLLDEPERHLHRSIISPLLNSLISKRRDCSFIVSTHDTNLPTDCNDSKILLIRSCQWSNNIVSYWDADLLMNSNDIPFIVKKEILGAKRNILFVEGNETSLDKQIYQLIYPNTSIISQKSCTNVEKAVIGIRNTEALHWINAFGLIDADDRSLGTIEKLKEHGIIALECYSIEGLYYNEFVIKKVIQTLEGISTEDFSSAFDIIKNKILSSISSHKDRLCARLCERKIRNEIQGKMPSHTEIKDLQNLSINIDIKDKLDAERNLFDEDLKTAELDSLLSRYPIRETPIIKDIVDVLRIPRIRYESIVRKLVTIDKDILPFYRSKLLQLTSLMGYSISEC